MFKESPPESVCLIRLSHIGDTCHALAVVRAIQDFWPATQITWIIGKVEAELMGDIPDIKFITFDKNRGREAYRQLKKELANYAFDVALCMHASMRVNPIYRMINTSVKLGFDYKRARDLQWLYTSHRIAERHQEHVLDGMMGFAHYIGVKKQIPRWDIPISDADRAFAMQHVGKVAPILTISPCSSMRRRNFRNWHADRYAAVANYAHQNFGCRIVLTGGTSDLEKEYGRRIQKSCEHEIVNLIGKTNLKQLLAVLNVSAALICPDSGPAHMATAVNTPVIGLYATSNPDRSGPYLSRHLTVNAYPDAAKHFLGKRLADLRWGQRVRSPGAMALVHINDVIDRMNQVFSA